MVQFSLEFNVCFYFHESLTHKIKLCLNIKFFSLLEMFILLKKNTSALLQRREAFINAFA